jgi:single-strand DNA-binding protein
VAEQYLKKGSKVYIEGQLQTRKYTDKDGTEKYSTEIVLQKYRGELTMLDGRGDGDRAERPAMAGASAGASEGGRSFQRGDLDDEIPF